MAVLGIAYAAIFAATSVLLSETQDIKINTKFNSLSIEINKNFKELGEKVDYLIKKSEG
jgi:hypothetical protein